MPNLLGRVALVTGGATGIGFETARLLAQRGAKVYLTSRTESRARQSKEILDRDPNIDPCNIQWLIMDLSDPQSVTIAADQLKKKEEKVDILINNAAASTSSVELVDGKYEQHMAANHLGPFLLVDRLLPLLKKAVNNKDADVRVINLSSTAQTSMLPSQFEFSFQSAACFKYPVLSYPWQWRFLGRFLFGFDMIRYSVSKVAVVLFTQQLQRRLDEEGLPILCITVHPGEVLTEGVLAINNALIRAIARMSFLDAENGAANTLFAATAAEVRNEAEKYKGRFLIPVGRLGNPNSVAKDDQQAKGLWENTVAEVNKWLLEKQLPLLETE